VRMLSLFTLRTKWCIGSILAVWTVAAAINSQAQDVNPGASSPSDVASTTEALVVPSTAVQPTRPPTDKPSRIESSLFSSLFMAGKTQDQFVPLTPRERIGVYSRDLFSPVHFALAGLSAGITQAQDSPKQWGQGAAGYGTRFANYYAEAVVADVLQMTGEDLLHEDNLYYGSGETGFGSRVAYAVKSSVLARGRDGTQHFSISQVGSTAAASFISRLWQPAGHGSASDGAVNFGISMATNAGVNVVREFLPDFTRHIFRRSAQ
jgi:hypothetical protein